MIQAWTALSTNIFIRLLVSSHWLRLQVVCGLLRMTGDCKSALKNSIISVAAIYGFYIVSYLLHEAASRFGLKDPLSRFQIFTGYASVVVYVLYVFIPFFSDFFILWLLVIYTFYVVQTGAIYYLKVPTSKRTDFTIFASVLIVLVPTLIRNISF